VTIVKSIMILSAAVLAAAVLTGGCREQLQGGPPAVEGDELIMAAALRQHMRNHEGNYKTDYKYIFLKVLEEDPSREFMEYFDYLLPTVLPGSKMVETRFGYEKLPSTKGIWILFEVDELKIVSDQEAHVTCSSHENGLDHPAAGYRMEMVDGRWRATNIFSIDGDGNM
jgi:hypothetical protein